MLHRSVRTPPVAPRSVARGVLIVAWTALAGWSLAGCGGDDAGGDAGGEPVPVGRTIASAITGAPDVLPTMANRELPFRYPAELYGRRVQGNVTLRLYLDSTGTVIADSTRVEEGSGHAELDSAAINGSRDLRFNPARRRGSAIAVSLLYPVYFRHPEAAPLPGDSILQ
jgi:TonB family protein